MLKIIVLKVVLFAYRFIFILLIAVFLNPLSQKFLQMKANVWILCNRIVLWQFMLKEHEESITHWDFFIVEFIYFILHILWRFLMRKHKVVYNQIITIIQTKFYPKTYLIWNGFIPISFRIIAVIFLLLLCSRLSYYPLKWGKMQYYYTAMVKSQRT